MFTVFFQGHFYYKADEICILIHFFQFFKIKCCQHVSVQGPDSADEMGQSSLNIRALPPSAAPSPLVALRATTAT